MHLQDGAGEHVRDRPLDRTHYRVGLARIGAGADDAPGPHDLLDRHPANTPKDLRDLTDEDYQTNILSVSTIEHINMDDLGIKQNAITAMDVLSRIRTNAKKYFVTFPLGYNAKLDQYVFASIPEALFVTRREDDQNDWKIIGKTDLSDAQKKYGGYCGANTFCVISNGYGPLGATK